MNDASHATPDASSLLRDRGSADSGRVGMAELFFDLVFVFAVTQLSHTLLAHPDPGGALRVGLLLAGVWWVWIYTSWVTNWLDPERLPVRLCLFALMLAGLAMSASLPRAFADRGWIFALAYVAMQVGRTLFFLWAVRHEHVDRRRNFQRILVWLTLSGALWLAGGFGAPEARLAWWATALAVEIVSPAIYFWVPGLGRSTLEDWDVDGGHLSERCGLFVIIALGESLLVTGATFAEAATWQGETIAGFLSAFIGSVVMWWLYFHRGADEGHDRIAHTATPGRYARASYTYLHLPIVAGIIVNAVADDIVVAGHGHAGPAQVAIVLGGPALYLSGVAAFKWVSNVRALPPLSHLIGLALFAGLAVPSVQGGLSLLAMHGGTTLILLVVSVWEEAAHGRR